MVYGMEAVMPTDIEHDSPRVVNYAEEDNEEDNGITVKYNTQTFQENLGIILQRRVGGQCTTTR
jgi:hypothetical protein